jgi:hypothetical protein
MDMNPFPDLYEDDEENDDDVPPAEAQEAPPAEKFQQLPPEALGDERNCTYDRNFRPRLIDEDG